MKAYNPSRQVRPPPWLSILVAAAFSFLPLFGHAQAEFTGQVLSAVDADPVPGAHITLDADPADAEPEFERRAGPFGLFSFADIPTGFYQVRVRHPAFVEQSDVADLSGSASPPRTYELIPLVAGKSFFDLYLQAHGVVTGIVLPQADVTIERYDAAAGGVATRTVNLPTDDTGSLVTYGWTEGHYRFGVRKDGWDDLFYPETGRVFLDEAHAAQALLKPVEQTIQITVNGFNPVTETTGALAGVTVELTGLDPLVDDEVYPLQSRLTPESGMTDFDGLPPVRWQLQAKRLGYTTEETIIEPQGGLLPDRSVDLVINDTVLEIELESVYRLLDILAGAKVRLVGLNDSNTEGIEREQSAQVAEGRVVARFENLLPGRYWVHVVHEKTVNGLPADSILPNSHVDSFRVSFYSEQAYFDVLDDRTTAYSVKLRPRPAVVSGYLMATDDILNLTRNFTNPEPHRIFAPKEQAGIEFVVHESVSDAADMQLVPPDKRIVSVDSDASGYYRVSLIPGRYGVRIPSMTDYTGHNIELTQTEPSGTPSQGGGWPYPHNWDYATFEFGHYRAWDHFNSGEAYQLNLFVHRQTIDLVGRVIQDPQDPTGSMVLAAPDGDPIIVSYNDLVEAGGEAVLTGNGITRRAPFLVDNLRGGIFFILEKIPPGTYTIRGEHPRNAFNEVSITISDWNAPGIKPPIAPDWQDPTYYFPGLPHDLPDNMQATFNTSGTITVETRRTVQVDTDPVQYACQLVNEVAPSYYRADSILSGNLFAFPAGAKPPPGDYTIWRNYLGDGWFTDNGNGSRTFEAFITQPGDPDVCGDNTPPTPPPWQTSYTLEARAVNIDDPGMDIPNVTLHFPDDKTREAGTTTAFDGRPRVVDAVEASGKWTFRTYREEVVDAAARVVRVTARLKRTMLIEGTVDSGGAPLRGARVALRSAAGTGFSMQVTGENGTFQFAGLPPQPLFLDVEAKGYIPWRRRVEPQSAENPDVSGVVAQLEPLPPPVIDPVTLDRFGLFLPGISKTGESDARLIFASGALKFGWSAEATTRDVMYTLPNYDGNATPETTYTVSDPVVEVWIIDQRSFSAPSYNLAEGDEALLDIPDPFVYQTVIPWLSDIATAERDGSPLYVKHQRTSETDETNAHRFKATMDLSSLPAGEFHPVVVAITSRGAVGIKFYRYPATRHPLKGLRVPPWLAAVADLLGGKLDGTSVDSEELAKFVPKGRILPLPSYSIDITETGGYVKYIYDLTISLLEGAKNQSGDKTLRSGAKNLGYGMSGTARIIVNGQTGNIALQGSAALTRDFLKKSGQDMPAKPPPVGITPEKLVLKGQASVKITENLTPGAVDQRGRIPQFKLTETAFGFLESQLSYNVTPIVTKIPYVGPVLKIPTLPPLNATYKGLLTLGAGGDVTTQWQTYYPVAGSTTTEREKKTRRHVLGGTSEEVSNFNVRWKYGLGVKVATNSRLVNLSGEGNLIVGKPRGAKKPGVVFTPNLDGTSPFFHRVRGAISLNLDVSFSVALLSQSKSWTFDFVTFDKQLTTEPVFQVEPIGLVYTRMTPAAVPPTAFMGQKDGLILDAFSPFGSLDVADGSTPALVFTDTDPASGEMALRVSLLDTAAWSTPVTVSSAPGITEASIVRTPAGGWLAVWTIVEADQIGNLSPETELRFAMSTDGARWSTPQLVPGTGVPGSADVLRLASGAAGVFLTYLSTEQGALAATRQVRGAWWDGSGWSTVDALPEQRIADYDLSVNPAAGGPEAVLLVNGGDGTLNSYAWDGAGAWSSTGPLSSNAATAPMTSSFTADGTPVVVWLDRQGRFQLATGANTGLWDIVDTGLVSDAATDLAVLPLNDDTSEAILMVWSEGGDETRLHHAYLTRDGAILKGRTLSPAVLNGVRSRFNLRSAGGLDASLVSVVDDGGSRRVTENPVVFARSAPAPPRIVEHPGGGTALEGTDVTLSSRAEGAHGLEYEWMHDFIPVEGGSDPVLLLQQVSVEDAGDYSVKVSNAADIVLSDDAVLDVVSAIPFELHKDWNLISSPVTTDRPLGEIFRVGERNGLISGAVWTWNATENRYRRVDVNNPLQAGRAYWVFSPAGGDSEPFAGTVEASASPGAEGWHMIGPTRSVAGPVPTAYRPVGTIWGWRDGKYRAVTAPAAADALRALQGYWIYHVPAQP